MRRIPYTDDAIQATFSPKKSQVSGHRSASKSVRLLNFCKFFCNIYIYFLPPGPETKFPIIQSMVAKRGLTNQAYVHTPYVKTSFKTQHGRIPIDPAISAAIGHRFIAHKKEQKIKNAEARVWGDARGDQKPEIFCCWPWMLINGYVIMLLYFAAQSACSSANINKWPTRAIYTEHRLQRHISHRNIIVSSVSANLNISRSDREQ